MATTDLTWGYVLAAAAYAALAVHAFQAARKSATFDPGHKVLILALGFSAAWATFTVWAATAGGAVPLWLAVTADLARYALWFRLLAPWLWRPGESPRLALPGVLGLLGLSWVVTSALVWGPAAWHQLPGVGTLLAVLALGLALLGLLLVEQVLRDAGESVRWRVKPLCLGLGMIFAFDLYLQSEVLLFGQPDGDAVRVRGLVHALAVPLLYVASMRGRAHPAGLKLSRSAAFHSATLMLVGIYLLAMAAVGYYVRYFGGTWGRALQIVLLAGGGALLLLLLFSASVRSWLKVFLSKHFYSYRYDYREEWLRFTAMLSSCRSPQQTGEVIVQGLARMVECPAGTLWSGTAGHFNAIAAWNTDLPKGSEASDSPLCRFLAEQGWVIDMTEFRSAPRHYDGLVLPIWLLSNPRAWLVVPLMAGDDLVGFVVLNQPLTALKLDWEVLDLLKTAGRQAAGYLAQMHATEALLEARKFEAFNRMSAFVVHDLKNIVSQLSLMLKNAERLHDNPEFQADMRLTVQSSLEKMKRMMLQLREGAAPPGGARGVELATIAQRLQQSAKAQGRTLELDVTEHLSTRGHEERLERVLGHLVQNALDATPATGRVALAVGRHAGQVVVEVSDTGCGMSEEFIRTQLFRPFSSTKKSGMGIGSYESQQYVQELGGRIEVDSHPGRGTVMTVVLPLLDAARGSDLVPLGGT